LSEHEEMLNGGNINQVVKVGGTVRRNAKPNPYVYDLLKHLEVQGFAHSPRYLGQDDQGREVLTYLEGDVPGGQLPRVGPLHVVGPCAYRVSETLAKLS